MKNLIKIITCTLFLFTFPLNLGADEPKSDDVDGSFQAIGYNNPVELQSFHVFDSAGLIASVLTPQEHYLIQFTVFDADTIEDIKKIDIVFYYTEAAATPRDFENLLETKTTLSGEEVVIRLERDISSADNEHPENYAPDHPQDFEIVFAEGIDASLSTWEVTQSTTSSILPAGQTTPTAFTFELALRISKVAPESTTGEWRFGMKITDGAYPNYSDLYTLVKPSLNLDDLSDPSPTGFNMNFYGELRVPSQAAILWSGVEPGMTYDHPNALAVLENVVYIANGEYVHENSLNAFWVISGAATDGTTFAALTAEAFDGPQQFAVRAGMNVLGLSEPEDGIQMEPGGAGDLLAYAPIVLRERSDETGHPYDFYYWLALSEVFQNAQYSGLITAKVNNSVAVSGVSVVAFTGNVENSLLAANNPQTGPQSSSNPAGAIPIYTWTDLSCVSSSGNRPQCSDPKYNEYTDDANYILMNDLNVSTSDYAGLADEWQAVNFSGSQEGGHFNGNGFTISDLIVTKAIDGDRLGLFGLANGVQIENLTIQNATVGSINDNDGAARNGVLAGILQNSSVNNVTLSGFSVYGKSEVGALAGSLNSFSSSNFIRNINLIGTSQAPSLVGCVNGERCYAIGGLIGSLDLSQISFSDIHINHVIVDGSNMNSGLRQDIGGFAGQAIHRYGTTILGDQWGNIKVQADVKPNSLTISNPGVVFGLVSGDFPEIFDPNLIIQYKNLGSLTLNPIGEIFTDANDFTNSITFEALP